ncbi:MAG: hypothetical protein ACI8ZN_002646, partial [Bacteroidia bacterium]
FDFFQQKGIYSHRSIIHFAHPNLNSEEHVKVHKLK